MTQAWQRTALELAVGTASLCMVRMAAEHLVLRPIAGFLGLRAGPSAKPAEVAAVNKQLATFSQSMWKFAYHGCLAVVTLAGLNAYAPSFLYRDHPEMFFDKNQLAMARAASPTDEFELLGSVYRMETLWYLHQFVYHFVETAKNDHLVMLAHHVITLMLIGASWHMGFVRIGVVTIFLHDASEMLFLSKALNVLDHVPGVRFALLWKIGAPVSFVGAIVSWAFTRLYWFPTIVIDSAAYVLPAHQGLLSGSAWLTPEQIIHSFLALLLALQAMHVYWFLLILRILWGLIVTGQAHDTHEEGHDESKGTKKTQ